MKYGSYYNLTLKESPEKGRGVFAAEEISAGKLILVEPALMFSGSDIDGLRSHKLFEYIFQIGDSMAISLGVGTFINHSEDPNVRVNRQIDQELFEVFALRDITPGEELTHKYIRELWFSPAAE
ncbi:SET domain-containing protein-lysine N-methyltransferase [Moorena producens]|uniref:SET domain-containing protein-lysine N-methyltransferase n=1 Tax=Moorena producens TaxID=1155739 RepID=UPI003C77EE13